MRQLALVLSAMLVPTLTHAQTSRELTTDERARLFQRSDDVKLASKTVRIPMRGADHAGNRKCPYFQVYVNGSGPFTFLYDTGASYLSVGSKVAKAAGAKVVIDRGGHRDVVELKELRIGGIIVRSVWAIQDDSWGVDGVLGFPTLGTVNVLFDLARREIQASRKPIPMPRSFTLRYEDPFNVPTVPVGIGGRNVPILIDTGDDAYGLEIRSSELGDAAVTHPPVAAGIVMNGAMQQTTAVTTLRDAVTMGPTRASRAQIAINDDLPVGDLGYDALKQFRFQIDPTRRTVSFQPLFTGAEFELTAGRSTVK